MFPILDNFPLQPGLVCIFAQHERLTQNFSICDHGFENVRQSVTIPDVKMLTLCWDRMQASIQKFLPYIWRMDCRCLFPCQLMRPCQATP